MLTKSFRKAHAHIWDSVAYETQHLEFKVFLEKLFLVHSFTAHVYENLSPFESCGLEEVLFDVCNNRFLSCKVVIEFL